MLRAIAGVIVGYVVMFILVMCTFIAAGLMLSSEQIFRPGSYEPSNLWIAMSFVTGLLAAIFAGWLCVLIAGTRKAAAGLVVVVIAMGTVSAVLTSNSSKPDPGPRTGTVTMMEARDKARQPLWLMIAFPVIGSVGVLIGASLKKDRKVMTGSVAT